MSNSTEMDWATVMWRFSWAGLTKNLICVDCNLELSWAVDQRAHYDVTIIIIWRQNSYTELWTFTVNPGVAYSLHLK